MKPHIYKNNQLINQSVKTIRLTYLATDSSHATSQGENEEELVVSDASGQVLRLVEAIVLEAEAEVVRPVFHHSAVNHFDLFVLLS